MRVHEAADPVHATFLLPALFLPAQVYRQDDPGVKPPIPVRMVAAEDSEEAHTAKVQGRAQILMIVDEKGIPEKIHVVQFVDLEGREIDDHGLSGKAYDAMAQRRFKPATKDGNPVAAWARGKANFRLGSTPNAPAHVGKKN